MKDSPWSSMVIVICALAVMLVSLVKPGGFALPAVLTARAASAAAPAQPPGRYQVVPIVGALAIKLDTATGQTWTFTKDGWVQLHELQDPWGVKEEKPTQYWGRDANGNPVRLPDPAGIRGFISQGK